MENRKVKRLLWSLFAGLGLSIIALAVPGQAIAGGIRISIGVPVPVYVAPPPTVVYPAPIVVQPSPRFIYPPPVAFSVPYDGYGRPLPPGLAKKYYGYHPAYGYKFYKHDKRYRKHYHDDD